MYEPRGVWEWHIGFGWVEKPADEPRQDEDSGQKNDEGEAA